MNKNVKSCFADDLVRDGEGVDALLLVHGTGEEHVLATEVQDGIVLVKEIACADGLVTEHAHVGSLEACQLEFTLGDYPAWIFAE